MGDSLSHLDDLLVQRKCHVLARCARGKIKANNMADIEEEILLQANLFLLLVLKVTSHLQRPKKSFFFFIWQN